VIDFNNLEHAFCESRFPFFRNMLWRAIIERGTGSPPAIDFPYTIEPNIAPGDTV
jgi:hypothetical protein